MSLTSTNPATAKLVREYDEHTAEEADRIIESVAAAQGTWQSTELGGRARLMRKAAGILRDRAGDHALLMTAEMGKPVTQGRSEAEKCAWVCEYYADNAAEFLAPERIESDASESFVVYRPLGTVLAVMPWNFPFWQVFRFAAPTLMAGNTALLKHASNVSECALAIEGIFRDAGFPDNVFRTLLVSGKNTGRVIENRHINAVSITGSTEAGKSVAATAGAALKKTVLELGGSDAYVILEDADLQEAAETCVTSRLINSGQSCIAAKRFVVPANIRDHFEELFVTEMRRRKLGDPTKEETEIGPQARADLRDDLHRQVLESIDKGARCLLGGFVPEDEGAWYPATVLTDVGPGMPAYDEELFGPVAAIIPVADEDEAIRVANDSAFGLGAAVMTRDVRRGKKIAAEQLEAGACFVNTYVKSDPRLPFGGIKDSGYGRELGRNGIHEFVNIKTVYIR